MTAVSNFARFLEFLAPDAETAAERYEDLRLRITRVLHWRGCPESHADSLADDVLDRVATKVAEGAEIASINAYAAGVCRFVWLEHRRRNREDAAGDDLPEGEHSPQPFDEDEDDDDRLACLRKCIAETAPDEADRSLLLRYYGAGDGEKNKEVRAELARGLGISATNLRVKAFRIRARVEKCVADCINAVTESPRNVISMQEEA
jgi:DNA-directed RNA polymerase specialized sigma24 family protein